MQKPVIILDDAAQGRMRLFFGPKGVIRADTPEDVPAALAALQALWEAGLHLAGYFSYELGYLLEPVLAPLLPARRDGPLLWFGVFDPPKTVSGPQIEATFDEWNLTRAYAGAVRFDWDMEAYGARFDRVRELIMAGDLYQANLTFGGGFAFHGDPLALYRRLRKASASAYGAFVDDGDRQILSLSPELFFELTRGRLTVRPMKGTAARATGRQADEAARRTLQESPKDRAENLMIVDLMRNDLGRIAQTGSVTVSGLFTVETYPTVHQMVSTVQADIKRQTTLVALLQALFPCGSVTGAPKIRAMKAIAELEDGPRGVYCGAVGWLGPDSSAQFNVAIRTVMIADGAGRLHVGGGVVQDSRVGGEYEECRIKARFLTEARHRLELIETMRFSPRQGVIRLELHMARLQRSAKAFAIAFDHDAALAAMAEAVRDRDRDGDLMVRLVLTEDGLMSCSAAKLSPAPLAWTYAIGATRVNGSDPLAVHKTNMREHYEREYARLHDLIGCDEVIFLNHRGEVAEGRRSSIFVARDGKLATPPLDAGVLDGCLRRELIEQGFAFEAALYPDDLNGEVYFGNSLRDLIRGTRLV